MTTEDKVLELKKLGNDCFKKHKFGQAIDYYTQALDLDPENAVLLCNRAFCHIKREDLGLAIADATSAIAVDKKCIKAYYRRGTAFWAQNTLSKLKLAEKDFKQALKLNPKDKDCQRRHTEVSRAITTIRYRKAMQVEEEVVSETIKLDDMIVPSDYSGPRLEGKYTAAFADELIEHFKNQKLLPKKYVYRILLDSLKLFQALPSLVDVDVPTGTHITVCGDTHGQFYDVVNLFKLNGKPSEENPYVFNGDFVDRGSFSLEVILTFLVYKNLYPRHFHLTRGNHESLNMNNIYGFEGEVKQKVDGRSFDLFTEVFNWLPLGMLIGQKVLVVHGGLFSEDGVKLDQIRKIDRNRQPPETGLMCELLWSDPQYFPGRAPSKRGVGLSFGPDVSQKFLDENGLTMLIRSHEVKENGYELMHNDRVVTVFSAPNYCDSMGNKGAYIHLDDELKPTYHTFTAVPHPPIAPMAYAHSMMRGF